MNSKICSRSNKMQGRNSRIDEKEELMRKEEAKTKFAMLYKELEDLKILEKQEEQKLKRKMEDKELFKRNQNGELSENMFNEFLQSNSTFNALDFENGSQMIELLTMKHNKSQSNQNPKNLIIKANEANVGTSPRRNSNAQTSPLLSELGLTKPNIKTQKFISENYLNASQQFSKKGEQNNLSPRMQKPDKWIMSPKNKS